MGACANKEPLPGESMPQTSLCTVISLAQTELLIPQVRHIKGVGAPCDPPTPPGRQGSAARGFGSGPGGGRELGRAFEKGRKCGSHLRADSQAEGERDGCLGILGQGGKGIMRDQRATEHHKPTMWLKGKPLADRGKDGAAQAGRRGIFGTPKLPISTWGVGRELGYTVPAARVQSSSAPQHSHCITPSIPPLPALRLWEKPLASAFIPGWQPHSCSQQGQARCWASLQLPPALSLPPLLTEGRDEEMSLNCSNKVQF